MLESSKEIIANDANEELDTKENYIKDNKQQISFLHWINPFATTAQVAKHPDQLLEATINEYKGVQGLKQFWNNRICAVKDTKQKSATLGSSYPKSSSVEHNLTSSKSVNCLVSDQSDHQSEDIKRPKEAEGHSQVDNFYKYKTAATRKRLSEEAVASELSGGNTLNGSKKEHNVKVQKITSFGANFPLIAATETGEKIHWAKREDIFVNCKQKQNTINTVRLKVRESQSETTLAGAVISSSDKDKLSAGSIGGSDTDMAIKSSVTTITTPTMRSSDKTDSSRSHNGSTNSLSSDSPARKRISTPRKYSFKTHVKNYYTPRKMAINVGGSKVAALTHQFNQMIQKDAAILEEVKKKNGVLMTRAGHVYKIKEGTEVVRRRIPKRNSSDDDISGKTAKKKYHVRKQTVSRSSENAFEKKEPGKVKATIQKFEKGDNKNSLATPNIPPIGVKLQKPEIPSKSEQVLQRTKEIALRNSLKRLKGSSLQIAPESPKILDEIKEESKISSDLYAYKEETACKNDNVNNLQQNSSDISDSDKVLHVDIEESDGVPQNTLEMDFEEAYRKKGKCSRLYEKFLSRSNRKQSNDNEKLSLTLQENGERKILDALETVNKKLDHLSKSTSDVRLQMENHCFPKEVEINMKPNDSFLFRRNSKTALDSTTIVEDPPVKLIEAVNTRLINKTQSMDETRFPSLQIRQISLEEREYPNLLKQTDDLLSRLRGQEKADDDLYEPVGIHSNNELLDSLVQPSFIFRSTSKEEKEQKVPDMTESIYQTVVEVIDNHHNSINSYESYDNYELVPEDCNSKRFNSETEDEYEICDPPEPPPPRKSDPDIIRNSTDKLPALPTPKRIIPATNLLQVDTIRKAPPRPPKSPQVSRPELPEIPHVPPDNGQTCHDAEDSHYDDENIYDTIKSSESASHCYEILNTKNPKSLDTVSVTSNCYESINSIRRAPVLRHSDSLSTLSSEQKTNSLYGMTLGQNSSPTNEVCSDNSDDWVDISDGEEEASGKHNFIVVRERAKCHRSPVWSKKVRDKRIHQQVTDYDGKL